MKKDFISDYMCAIQAKFFIEPRFSELEQEITRRHEDTSQSMEKDERRKSFKFIDTTGELQGRITLAGFDVSFRLVGGIAKN